MDMYDKLTKVKGKAIWEYEHEFTTERIVKQKNGDWRHEDSNGGANGAWEKRADTVHTLSAQEATNMLREWGVDDDYIAAIEGMEDFAPADLPD